MDENQLINAKHWARQLLYQSGMPESAIVLLTIIIDLTLLLIISWMADVAARKILLSIVKRLVLKTKAQWDDYLLEGRVFQALAHLLPVIIIKQSLPFIFDDFPNVIPVLNKLTSLIALVMVVLLFARMFKSLERYFIDQNKFDGKPVGTIFQVLIVVNIFLGVIIAISILTSIKPGTLLGAFAGTTAILILVFQDTINGILANLQITMYDLIKRGDWITFDKYGADGDVVSIDLTTVKIQNFDKTISTVPTRAFVNDSFVNWRGMREFQARRIKRNIIIDINSIKHMDDFLLNKLSQVALIKDYLHEKQTDIDRHNAQKGFDLSVPLNGRRQTNIGAFRAYVSAYLKSHPGINSDILFMVRQLQPTPHGVPLEIYCFTNTIVWATYEQIQSDIFDHLYAASNYFDLILYQSPSGKDMRSLSSLSAQVGAG
jgi:miniconductance mechanosensitive channel